MPAVLTVVVLARGRDRRAGTGVSRRVAREARRGVPRRHDVARSSTSSAGEPRRLYLRLNTFRMPTLARSPRGSPAQDRTPVRGWGPDKEEGQPPGTVWLGLWAKDRLFAYRERCDGDGDEGSRDALTYAQAGMLPIGEQTPGISGTTAEGTTRPQHRGPVSRKATPAARPPSRCRGVAAGARQGGAPRQDLRLSTSRGLGR